jgi:hypothetical protein
MQALLSVGRANAQIGRPRTIHARAPSGNDFHGKC